MVDATTIVHAPGPAKLWLTERRFLRGPPLFHPGRDSHVAENENGDSDGVDSAACSGGAAPRAFPGALKRGLGRGPDGPRLVFKDVPAQSRSRRHQPSGDSHVAENNALQGPLSWGRVGGSAISKALASSAALMSRKTRTETRTACYIPKP